MLFAGSALGAQVDSVATPDIDATPIASMFRGGPARTGEMPGPVPAGKPELRWRFTAGNDIDSSPAVAGDTVFVGSDDGRLYAIDATKGDERWHFEIGGDGRTSPAVAAGPGYIGRDSGHHSALRARTRGRT